MSRDHNAWRDCDTTASIHEDRWPKDRQAAVGMIVFCFCPSATKDTLQRCNSDLEHGDQEKVQCRRLWSIQVQEDRGGDSPRGLEPKHCSSPHLALRPSCTRWLLAFTRRVPQGLSQNHAWYEKQNPAATRPQGIISRTRLWWERDIGACLYHICYALLLERA